MMTLMTFSQIQTKAWFLSSSNSTSFPLSTLTVEANNALDRLTSLIIQADGRWEFDDANNTDLPIAVTDLVSGQQDYSLLVSHLEITRMEIMDTNSTWHKLIPIDQADVYNQAMTDFLNAPGLPIYYDKLANSIFLYPAPNYSQASSLKVYFQRGPNYFLGDNSSGDNSKVPGFNSIYHELIPLWIAYNFAVANGKQNAANLLDEIQRKEDALVTDYALRAKDDHIRLKSRPHSWR